MLNCPRERAPVSKIPALPDDEVLHRGQLGRCGIFRPIRKPADLGQAAHEQEQRQHGQIFLRDGPDFAISRHACSIVGTKLGKLLTLIQGPVTVAALLVTEPTPFDIVTE